MKIQKQIVCDPNTCDLEQTEYGLRMGRVQCPFCDITCDLVSHNQGPITLGYVCEHAVGTVQAHGMNIAIHFVKEIQ